MILVHTRRGCLVPALLLAAVIVTWLVARPFEAKIGSELTWFLRAMTIFVIAGVALILLGRRIRRREGRVVWNPRRARYTRLPTGDTFFWIDLWHWGWMLLVIGAVVGWIMWKDLPG